MPRLNHPSIAPAWARRSSRSSLASSCNSRRALRRAGISISERAEDQVAIVATGPILVQDARSGRHPRPYVSRSEGSAVVRLALAEAPANIRTRLELILSDPRNEVRFQREEDAGERVTG